MGVPSLADASSAPDLVRPPVAEMRKRSPKAGEAHPQGLPSRGGHVCKLVRLPDVTGTRKYWELGQRASPACRGSLYPVHQRALQEYGYNTAQSSHPLVGNLGFLI